MAPGGGWNRASVPPHPPARSGPTPAERIAQERMEDRTRATHRVPLKGDIAVLPGQEPPIATPAPLVPVRPRMLVLPPPPIQVRQ
jgi:hypothetical protein